jgi:arabinofuranosyltransferase
MRTEILNDPFLERKRFIAIALTSLFFIVLLRTAWISDDAAITLRTVLNFLHGFGPVFNVGERVQGYTHPLWFCLLSVTTLLTKDVIKSAFILPILISLITFTLVLLRAKNNVVACIGGLVLLFSKAFVDFSTSGLENPLSHLIMFFFIVYASYFFQEKPSQRLETLFFLASCLYLTRPDLILLIIPLLVALFFLKITNLARFIRSTFVGSLPIILWTLLSLYYYGFPFPNTAYAKMGTGISHLALIKQGFLYLFIHLYYQPLTFLFIALGAIIGFHSSLLNRTLAFGIIFYVLYILYIGGDFMQGRFLTTPLLISVMIFVSHTYSLKAVKPFLFILSFLALYEAPKTVLSGTNYSNDNGIFGISDERGFYYQNTGLLRFDMPLPPWRISPHQKTHILCGGLGFFALTHGPNVHTIDTCGLVDPLLARLPVAQGKWRIGHFVRRLPSGYKESIIHNANLLADSEMRTYWESIRKITRSPLNDPQRLWEIFRINFNQVSKPNPAFYRAPDLIVHENGETRENRG